MDESANSTPIYKLKICDMHTCGEPIRIIETIEPSITFPLNSTISEKKKIFAENHDDIRKMAILEPRGHKDMFGVILTDPNEGSGAQFGMIFLTSNGYATMCGHATIAVGRYLIEKKFINAKSPETEIIFDCPCGTVKAFVEWDGNVVGNTKFLSVPAFVQDIDYQVYVPQLNVTLTCDIVFGGNFFAIVSDKTLGVDFNYDPPSKIVDNAIFLYKALIKKLTLSHPNNRDLEFLMGVYVTDGNDDSDVTKTMSVFGNKCFDRSPCGSGTTALVASQFFKGKLKLNQRKITQSAYLGKKSQFQGVPTEVVKLNDVGKKIRAVRVEIIGRAYFTSEAIMTFEKDDYFKFGFLL